MHLRFLMILLYFSTKPIYMNRRDALERVALIMGGTIIGGAAFLQGCKSTDTKGAAFSLTNEQIAFLDEVAETIIPTTNTPGAKAAKVGEFMHTIEQRTQSIQRIKKRQRSQSLFRFDEAAHDAGVFHI
jgi:hypothetical protein